MFFYETTAGKIIGFNGLDSMDLVTTQSDAWSVLGGFTRDVVVFQES